ncbi:hypothetical protein DFH29DRAFT_450764 [Suillus ampliporus]|nr:hypothetical protein DFH29DRAFT_450764 [Suillus ampliporus]
MGKETFSDERFSQDEGFFMFLNKFRPSPLTEISETVLLQLKEEYDYLTAPDFADHLLHEVISLAEETLEPSQPPGDPAESGAPEDTRCRWVDKETNQRCNEPVPAGLKPMLLHLNKVHGVRGGEKTPIECRWAVLYSDCESACGTELQRRGIPRHIAKHLGLRSPCELCDKDFARADLLRDHIRKDHHKA